MKFTLEKSEGYLTSSFGDMSGHEMTVSYPTMTILKDGKYWATLEAGGYSHPDNKFLVERAELVVSALNLDCSLPKATKKS